MAFHYTDAIARVLGLIVADEEIFSHVRLERVAVGFTQTRRPSRHGTYAKLVALGAGRTAIHWRFRGRRILYVLYVYLPRFHAQELEDQVLTLFHELYHVGPACDGRLRRVPGRSAHHGDSRAEYDRRLRPRVEEFLRRHGRDAELEFLRHPLDALEAAHQGIRGTWIRLP